jgi:hypothetical protein
VQIARASISSFIKIDVFALIDAQRMITCSSWMNHYFKAAFSCWLLMLVYLDVHHYCFDDAILVEDWLASCSM